MEISVVQVVVEQCKTLLLIFQRLSKQKSYSGAHTLKKVCDSQNGTRLGFLCTLILDKAMIVEILDKEQEY